MLRIESVEPLAGLKVKLKLTDGTGVERDLSDLLIEPLYSPVKDDRSLFEAVKVEYGTLVWPNGLDLDPDMVIWGGPPPAEQRQIG